MTDSTTHEATDPTLLDTRTHQPGEGTPLSVQSFGVSDRGRVRRTNEDQFVVGTLTGALIVRYSSLPQTELQLAAREAHLFVVADGMGGHTGGSHASLLAVAAIEDFLLNTLSWLFNLQAPGDESLLREFKTALQRADARVCEIAGRHPHLRGMGTTLTLACSFESELFIAHAGDSRCYLVRGGHIRQLTRDHTFADQLLDAGCSRTPEQARAIQEQFGHVVTNVVGGPDVGINVELHKVRLQAGDVVVLCTDGLTKTVDDARIRRAVEEADPRVACEELVALANDRGGPDNVTVIAARYAPRPDAPESVALVHTAALCPGGRH